MNKQKLYGSSVHLFQADIIESYKLGVNSYIDKPVNFDSFTKSVSDLDLYWVIHNQSPANLKTNKPFLTYH